MAFLAHKKFKFWSLWHLKIIIFRVFGTKTNFLIFLAVLHYKKCKLWSLYTSHWHFGVAFFLKVFLKFWPTKNSSCGHWTSTNDFVSFRTKWVFSSVFGKFFITKNAHFGILTPQICKYWQFWPWETQKWLLGAFGAKWQPSASHTVRYKQSWKKEKQK